MQTKRYAQEPIWLAQDVAGTRHTLTVLATVHARTAGPAAGNAAGVVTPATGPPQGVASWLAIRDQLMRPRRPFRFLVGPQVIAEIPPPAGNFLDPGPARPVFPPVDIELGPKPLAANCVGFNGTGSMLVEYTIQWSMPNPCPKENGVMAVLAHAWMSEDDLDEQYFLTRTYTGIVHLDPRVVGAASGPTGINPDQIRGLLLPPRTEGCYRTLVVRLSEDGYSLNYRVKDRQPQAFCNSFEVVKITASQRVRNVSPSVWEQVAGAAQMAAGAGRFGAALPEAGRNAREMMRSTGRGSFFGDLWNLGGSIFSFIEPALTAVTGAYKGIPVAVHSFEATAYGNPTSRYSELARAARVVCLFRLMRGTMIGQFGLAPWGGFAEQEDNADPKTSTIRIELTTRPVEMAPEAADVLWGEGENTMLTIPNANAPNVTVQRQIVGAHNEAIPLAVRQLLYGGTIRQQGNEWGWFSRAFAPDILSTLDASLRDAGGGAAVTLLFPPGHGVTNAMLNNVTLIGNSLIQALQNPCQYKEAMAFTGSLNPLKKLP